MLPAVSFVIFLVLALIGVRVFERPLATIWPLIAGCITLALVTSWKALS